VTRIRKEVYTMDAIAKVDDGVPSFRMQCIEGFHSFQNAKKTTMKMMWSSGTINNASLGRG
jgi:hypothetical protein